MKHTKIAYSVFDIWLSNILHTFYHKIKNLIEISGTTEERIEKIKSVLFS
jgi:hypothetical protein